MKRFIKTIILILIAAILCLSLFACAEDPAVADNSGGGSAFSSASASNGTGAPKFTVALSDGDEYDIVGSDRVEVEQGGAATFTVKTKEGYCISRVLYKHSEIASSLFSDSQGVTTITVSNVRYSMMLSVESMQAEVLIRYYPNGGSYINGGDEDSPYVIGRSLKHRLRPNTEIGTDVITRDGYVLTGWNTRSDASGEHIGLGSRVTVRSGETLSLYAEWEKFTPAGKFDYEASANGIVINKYLGTDKKVTVPSAIDGVNVFRIASGAFGANVETVIFPPTIKIVNSGAFTDSTIKELYFYDNIGDISDDCFVRCKDFSTVHVNAITAPRYGKNLYSEAAMADKYDILILNADKNKVIVFGGSGAYLSTDTKLMEKSLADDGKNYVCINMAVNGWFNGMAQIEMMTPYLRAGDVFIHAPETSSQHGVMYSVSMIPTVGTWDYNKLRMYYCLESNYDLFSLVDLRHIRYFFDGFKAFNDGRQSLKETSYTDYITEVEQFGTYYKNDLGWIDDRGNYAPPRDVNAVTSGEADIVPEYISDVTAHTRLNEHYDILAAKGVKVCFTNAPVNVETLEKRLANPSAFQTGDLVLYYGRPPEMSLNYSGIEDWVAAYQNAVEEYLHCTVLVPLQDNLYYEECFFDADYHLNDNYVPTYTGRITEALKKLI